MLELFKLKGKRKQWYIDNLDETYGAKNILIIIILRKKYSII